MSHIKDRLKQYKDKYSDYYKYAGVHVKVIQDMIEQLLADLEQDEKKTVGFRSVRNCQNLKRLMCLVRLIFTKQKRYLSRQNVEKCLWRGVIKQCISLKFLVMNTYGIHTELVVEK